jgi:thiol-disulfide isomerase/thioredoxin
MKLARTFLVSVFVLAAWTVGVAQAKLPDDPKMKLQGLDGTVYDLAEEHGNVILVSFGATWCTPCSAELRALEELLQEFHDKPVKFFWVSIDRPEETTNAKLKRYARERRVTFPVLRDTARMVFLQFTQSVRLPMILFLGKDGKIDTPVQFGMQTSADAYKANMRARLKKLLSRSGDLSN